MKTKMILVNDKPQKAYGIFRTKNTQYVDFSGERASLIDNVAAGTATEEDKARLHKLAAYLSPELALVADKAAAGTATKEDKARLNLITKNATRERGIYRILFLDWAYKFHLDLPEVTVLTLDNIARLDYVLEKTDLDVISLWKCVTFLWPGTIKESEAYVVLPNKRKVKVKVPKGKRLSAESCSGGPSPIEELTIEEQDFVDRLEATRKADAKFARAQQDSLAEEARKRNEAEKKLEQHLEPIANLAAQKAVEKMEKTDTFQRALRHSASPSDLKWWDNLRNLYDNQSELTNGAKWRAVAHKIIKIVNDEIQQNNRKWQTKFLSPRMLQSLTAKLNAPGANLAQIEKDYAETLRREVANAEKTTKERTKVRA